METKGVASVRSPVRNLQQFNAEVTHEAFVDAVVSAFREHYDIHEEVSPYMRPQGKREGLMYYLR